MEIKEIRLKTVEELNQLLRDWRSQLDDLNFRAREKQLKNIRDIREHKKNIARIMMALQEKNKQPI